MSKSSKANLYHDGQPHEYQVAISAEEPVIALRIDPARAPGEIGISSATLIDEAGKVVQRWNFYGNEN